MPETVTASGTVHWVGTGLSNGSGLGYVCDLAKHVVVYGRTRAKAAALLSRLGLDGRAEPDVLDLTALEAALAPGDIVVSMLPATEHASLLRLCLGRRAHFASTSYTGPETAAAGAQAERSGLVLLTEAGLDPGIDHLLAHLLVARAREVVGDESPEVSFASLCGGVPAVPNDFRYRFSWAPRGVLGALCSPARYIDGGSPRVVDHPWEATEPLVVAGQPFEAYPNRDSEPFIEQYGLPGGWRVRRFLRGTLRLEGWLAAWQPVFEVLRAGDPARIDALAAELAERYPTTAADLDRVVLSVRLSVRDPRHPDPDHDWSGRYELDLTGTGRETAMARCVSLPLAYGVAGILAGRARPGLHRAAQDAGQAREWLAFLEENGIKSDYEETLGHG